MDVLEGRRPSSTRRPAKSWTPKPATRSPANPAGNSARRLAARIRAVRSCTTALPGALADWLEGLTDASTGRHERAATRLAGAASGFDHLGLPFQAARARLARGGCLAESHPNVSVKDTRCALEGFDRLGAPVQAQEARALLRTLGEVPSRGRARSPTGGRLSSRELEVGRLVASGLSNAEVAVRLFISPRTVTTHLDRIYARLGLSSRVALTRYLADSGLLGEDDAFATMNLPVPNT